MKGTPWEFKERYFCELPRFLPGTRQNSAAYRAWNDGQNSKDNGNLFNALRSLGKEVEFLEYEHEDHVLQPARERNRFLEPSHCMAGAVSRTVSHSAANLIEYCASRSDLPSTLEEGIPLA